MLSPYPLELVSFESLDSPDNQFSQINRPITKDPFIEAGLKGFAPVEPFKLPASTLLLTQPTNSSGPQLLNLMKNCSCSLGYLTNPISYSLHRIPLNPPQSL
jgi:hypothetical protein